MTTRRSTARGCLALVAAVALALPGRVRAQAPGDGEAPDGGASGAGPAEAGPGGEGAAGAPGDAGRSGAGATGEAPAGRSGEGAASDAGGGRSGEGAAGATGDASASRLAVLPIEVGGAADETTGPALQRHLRDGLARGAFALIDAAEVERIAAGGCDARCLAALRDRAGAAFVLRSRVTVNDRDYAVALELLAARDGKVVASSEERCELCGLAEVGALVDAQAALLRRELEELIQGPPRLTIATAPPGALVLVDNQLVGTSPVEPTVLEGRHTVRVLLDGYVSEERRVTLAAGVREQVTVQLRREPKTARYRAFGWASLFAGLPAFAAGAALVALDGDPYRARCDAPVDRDPEGRCRFVFRTEVGGALALAAGAALVTAGVMLLVRTRDRTRPRRVQPVVGPTGLGLVGRF